MKLAIGNDIHLDHVRLPTLFLELLRDVQPDVVVLTGDISTGDRICDDLEELAQVTPCPVYFVLGNHDFWNRSIYAVREGVKVQCERSHGVLNYLDDMEPVKLSEDWTILGVDGWYDFEYSPYGLKMVDYRLIEEFRGGTPEHCVNYSRKLAQYHANKLLAKLPKVETPKALVVTHVPPFREASKHNGQPSEYRALGTFSSKRVGDAILTSQVETLVLAGHSHDPADVQISDKVRCVVGGATYGAPKWEILDI